MADSQQIPLFIHIPKTAGSTLMSLVWRQYKKENILHIESRFDNCLLEIPEDERGAFAFIGGHMCYGIHEMIPNNTSYFTILREPVKRVISYYNYIQSQEGDRFHTLAVDMEPEEFFQNSELLEINNGQVRRLFGYSGFDVGFSECTQEMLETVKSNISNRFSVVGLTERFTESYFLINKVYSWKPMLYVNKNITPRSSVTSLSNPELIATIKKYNRLDLELYNYAEELFDEIITRTEKSFQLKVKLFNKINRFINLAYSNNNMNR